MPQCEVLEHEGALGPDHAEEAGEDEGNHAGHHRSDRPKLNADKADGVNGRHTLTFDFADEPEPWGGPSFDPRTGRSHHDAFHVSAAEFETIFGRVKAKLQAIRSATPTGKSTPTGAGGFYFEDPDAHLLEVRDEAVAHLGRGQRTLARPLAAAHVGDRKRAGDRARGRGEPRRPMPLPSVRGASTSEAPTWPPKGTRSSPARRPEDPLM